MSSEGFGGLAAAVQAQMTSQGVPAAAPVAPVVAVPAAPAVPAPVATAPVPAITPDVPAIAAPEAVAPAPVQTLEVPTPIPFDFPDDALIDLGKGHIVSARELKQGGYRLSDYTQKAQAAAALKKDAEAVLAEHGTLKTERAQLDEFFRSEEAVLGYALQAFGSQQVVARLQAMGLTLAQAQAAVAPVAVGHESGPGPSGAPQGAQPEAMATVQDLQQTVAYLQHQLKEQKQTLQAESAAQTQQLIVDKLQQLDDAKAVAQYEVTLDSHIDSLVKSDPYLGAMPYIEQVFKFEVMKAQPQTFDELQAVLKSTAQAQVARLQAAELQRRKVQVMGGSPSPTTPAVPSSVGIEPPGGLPVTPSPANYFNANGQVDWKKLGGDAEASIRNAYQAAR